MFIKIKLLSLKNKFKTNKMNKKTALENLLFDSGLKIGEFANKIGVNESTFRSQLYNCKDRHIDYAWRYGRILGVDTIKGYADGVHFELTIK